MAAVMHPGRQGSAKKKISVQYVPEPKHPKYYRAMYSGLNNLSLKWEPSKSTWRSKSPDKRPSSKQKDGKDNSKDGRKGKGSSKVDQSQGANAEQKEVVPRRPRSATVMRFRYPQHFHLAYDPNERMVMERSVPDCVRHNAPKYGYLPMRQGCSYSPWASVTFMKRHDVKSYSLPHPLDDTSGKLNMTSTLSNTQKDGATGAADEQEEENPDLNGQYSYIHDQEREPNYTYDLDEDAGPQLANDFANGNEEDNQDDEEDYDNQASERGSDAGGGHTEDDARYSAEEYDEDGERGDASGAEGEDDEDGIEDETSARTPRTKPQPDRYDDEEAPEVEED